MNFEVGSYETEDSRLAQAGVRRPQPVHRQAFMYDGKLTRNGVERVAPDELKRLVLEPKHASPAELAAWQVEHKKKVTHVWMDAQTGFYNLHKCNLGKDMAVRKLQEQLSRPDCRLDPNPSYIGGEFTLPKNAIMGMTAFWDENCEAYSKKLESHPKREEFDALATLEEKLELDPDLFMDIYFLDRKTTPDPLSLTKFDFEKVGRAVAKVATLNARVVGSGKQKTLRIGWNLQDVIRSSSASAGGLTGPAVQRQMAKIKNRVARLKPHHDFMEKRRAGSEPSLVGSYHVEITGSGWKDEFYKPGRLWLDIQRPCTTQDVYDATFDFGPALKGKMLISANRDALVVHSRIMDTVDLADPEEFEDKREAFLQGFLYAMKRSRGTDEDEAKLAKHKTFSLGTPKPDVLPTRYDVSCRGTHRVPEWEDHFQNTYANESRGCLTFKDGELCEFELTCPWTQFKGVPSLEGTISGYKVADWPRHQSAVPREEAREDWAESALDGIRDDLAPGRKRKREDWGSLREYSMRRNIYNSRLWGGGEREPVESPEVAAFTSPLGFWSGYE